MLVSVLPINKVVVIVEVYEKYQVCLVKNNKLKDLGMFIVKQCTILIKNQKLFVI